MEKVSPEHRTDEIKAFLLYYDVFFSKSVKESISMKLGPSLNRGGGRKPSPVTV